uniref:Uncharacterized protein n=1 Tax=Arundo donax TaxID=35708 RepID=A0A0A9F4E8_ARUDO
MFFMEINYVQNCPIEQWSLSAGFDVIMHEKGFSETEISIIGR